MDVEPHEDAIYPAFATSTVQIMTEHTNSTIFSQQEVSFTQVYDVMQCTAHLSTSTEVYKALFGAITKNICHMFSCVLCTKKLIWLKYYRHTTI